MSRKIALSLAPLLCLLAAARYQCPQVLALLERLGPMGRLGGDYHQYYFGLQALRSGVCIYRDADYFAYCEQLGASHNSMAIFNPPGFFLLMEPFGQVEFSPSFWLFVLSSGLLAWMSLLLVCLCLWENRGLALAAAGLSGVIVFNSPQGVDNLALGQLGFLLIGFLALTWLCDEFNQSSLAGLALAAAVVVKMWPLLLLAYLARRRRWRTAVWTFVWLTLFSLLQLMRFGLPLHFAYLQHFGGSPSQGVMSQSVMGVLLTWFGPGILPLAGPLSLVFLGLGLALLWQSSPATENCSAQAARQWRLLEFSCYLLLALMCTAWSWPHHRLVLILPILALCASFARGPSEPTPGPWLLALLALCGYWMVDGDIVQVPLMFGLHQMLAGLGVGLACQAFAWFCLGYTLHNTQKRSRPSAR
ncbi:MAG: DUF2029 domain-containing protein [Candidatus Eremiobacteraeota bacterium]|nr:DUF2029 domain-containing protein [Candidatus Eremiobacteraeota bacterium]